MCGALVAPVYFRAVVAFQCLIPEILYLECGLVFCSKILFLKMPNKKKLRKEKLLVEKVAVTEKANKVVAAGTVSKVPSYNQRYHVKQVLERVNLDRAVLSKTDCKFTKENFERCKLGQYVAKIDSDREGVNVYVEPLAK